ncbi:MarR family winged helix-turn-helix transcriptional regulator [Actinoplanes sp. NPDC049802]|uniref:MarR family winged helix-turn-helix transcriptional regulator n=1 Tax=Actinoplanes sp. NPDC049802 TaxID=3154742 RepID=UPI0033C30204
MTETAVALMHLAHQLHRNLDRRLQADFTHPKPPEAQIIALWHVRSRPGITVREIADELQIQPNNASALITAMVNGGLLRRKRDDQDRRIVRLYTTEESLRRIDAVHELFTGYLEDALAGLDPAQRSAVDAALPALAEVVQRLRAASPRTP